VCIGRLLVDVGDVMTRDHRSGHLLTTDVTMTSSDNDNNNNAMTTQHTWDIVDNDFPVVSNMSYNKLVIKN